MKKVLITGASGLVGRAVSDALRAEGHSVEPLRRATGATDSGSAITWDPASGRIDRDRLEGLDAVIHLAGESIDGRWTAAKRARIRDSRVVGTRLLCETLAGLNAPPSTLVAASAIGFYGNRGDEVCDESSSAGNGFLADVAERWEATTSPALEAGIRTVNLRIGIVLSSRGGALPRMLLPFRLGLGGPVGSGRQYWSWIALDDLVGIILTALDDRRLIGPVNAVAPGAVRQREFATTLARLLRRPAFMPLPAFAVRAMLGEMGDALLLTGAHVVPKKLTEIGFEFRHPDLVSALRAALAER